MNPAAPSPHRPADLVALRLRWWAVLALSIGACAEAPPTQEVLLPAPMVPISRTPAPAQSAPPSRAGSGANLGPACAPLSSERVGDAPPPGTARDAALGERELRDAGADFERGDYSTALAGYRRAAAADPFLGLAHLGIAESHLFTDGDARAMGEALGRALALLPDNARAHLRFADLSAEAGEKQRAEAHYRCAVELRPDYAEARRHYARQLMSEGRGTDAERELTAALEVAPEDVETRFLLADVLEADKKPLDAAKQVEAAAAHVRTSAALYRRAATLYESGGNLEAARRARATADAIDPPEKSRDLRPLPKARERKR